MTLDNSEIRKNAMIRLVLRIIRILSIFVFVSAWSFTEINIIIELTIMSIGMLVITSVLINKHV